MADCKSLKPSICGDRGLTMPNDNCDVVRFEGVDDVEFKQGYCIDLYENVHAYDADGTELPFTVEPSTLDCCEVGEHEFTYTAVGKGNKMLPSFCIGKPMLHATDCGLMTKVVKRVVSILQALPPTILGIGRAIIAPGTTFDPLYDVVAVDEDGHVLPDEVTYEGRYDASTGKAELLSFDSDIEQNARHLYVDIAPIQSLNGYDHPWVGGAGKNKFNGAEVTTTSTSNWGVAWGDAMNALTITHKTEYSTGTPIFPLNLAVGTYVVSFASQTKPVSISLYTNGAYTDVLRSGATFTVASGNSYEIRFTADVGTPNVITKLQIESGSTATAYAPYSNICPISGHTEVVTQRTGKNLNPYEGVNYIVSNTRERFFLKAGTYTFSTDTGNQLQSGANYYIRLYDAEIDGNVITSGNITSDRLALNGDGTMYYGGSGYVTVTFTLLTDAWMCFGFNNVIPTTCTAIQLELGSTATDYEPYQGSTYHTDLGQTVYGGTLDVVSGELVVDRAMVTYDGSSDEDWHQYGEQGYWCTLNAMAKRNTYVSHLFCDKLPTFQSNYGSDFKGASYAITGWDNLSATGQNYIYMKCGDATVSDPGVCRAWLAENPLTVVYELASPQTIQLTPQEVQLLLGTNNVRSDGIYHPFVTQYLNGNSWGARSVNGVTYYEYHGFGYMNEEPFASIPMTCSHFPVKRGVEPPTSQSTPLADNALYVLTDGTTYVRYDAIEGSDVTQSLANWRTFLANNNVFVTVPSYSGTDTTPLDVEVIYSKPLEGATQLDIEGIYPITYHAHDVCGNETTETRYVFVTDDDITVEDTYAVACQGKTCYAVISCDEA